MSTTAALLDAMVLHGVPRMVYASSNHAVGMTPAGGLLGVDARPRPDTFYGVGKVAAEALLSLYADRYGISSVALRIGSFEPVPTTRRHLATWLSPADCLRMVEAALTARVRRAPGDLRDLGQPGRLVGPGAGPRPRLPPAGRRVRPRDGHPEPARRRERRARVGGLFATGEYDRRPFAQDD